MPWGAWEKKAGIPQSTLEVSQTNLGPGRGTILDRFGFQEIRSHNIADGRVVNVIYHLNMAGFMEWELILCLIHPQMN